jgi:hypothetical protein
MDVVLVFGLRNELKRLGRSIEGASKVVHFSEGFC